MATSSPNTGDPSLLSTGTDPLPPVREAVAVLERLLKLLYPEEPSLDIITVRNIRERYPLTGLGAPALAAIEQSRRIVRARADYEQAGLSEFHVGLIYLYWNDSRAAANQFALARQPWSLLNDAAAMCLAHYAQGLGLFHSYHNEAAMLQYGRAEHLLERVTSAARAERLATLEKDMRPLLTIAQATLRESLWPAEQQPVEALQAGYLTVPPAVAQAGHAAAADASPSAVASPPATRPEWAKRAMPTSKLSDTLGDAPPAPVPGHVAIDDRFTWYRVVEKKDDFLPDVAPGTWLLADREVDERLADGGAYVVVGGSRPNMGSIIVQAATLSSAMPYCYLGHRQTVEGEAGGATFVLDASGQPATEGALVLAVVEGFWYGPNGRAVAGDGS